MDRKLPPLKVAQKKRRECGLPDALGLQSAPLVAALRKDGEAGLDLFARRWVALFKEKNLSLADALAAFLPALEEPSLSEKAFRAISDRWVSELEAGWQHLIEENTRALHLVNQQLKQVDQARSEFISTLSHELRTPLTAIFGSCEMLAEDFPLSEEQGPYLSLIKSSAGHIHHLIEDILDFSRLEAGKLELRLEAVDFAALANEIIELLTPLLREKKLRLSTHFGNLPLVLADPVRLRQVLLNLLSNAVKFTSLEGNIEIAAKAESSILLVEVRDDGIGIPPEYQGEIFERFKQVRQLNPKGTRIQKGTGLGLPISRFLVELHGGKIDVDSIPGEGATFHFSIPLAP